MLAGVVVGERWQWDLMHQSTDYDQRIAAAKSDVYQYRSILVASDLGKKLVIAGRHQMAIESGQAPDLVQ
jgi:hypothetical protein